MIIFIGIVALVALAGTAYFLYQAYYSPSFIGRGYDQQLEKERLEREKAASDESVEDTIK